MTELTLEQLRFPIGNFIAPAAYTSEYLANCIGEIESFPERLKKEVERLNDDQLDTPYRPGGWTIRQVIHHCADSHMNCLIRMKWALTEDRPTIKFYYEDRWTDMQDEKNMPIAASMLLLEGLHQRMTYLMKSLSEEELQRSLIHPEHGKEFRLEEIIGIYAWHGNHHLAHITQLKKRQQWT